MIRRVLGTALVLLACAHVLHGQETIKFDFGSRYDTVLTSQDTAMVKLTLLEFHRKLAAAGYAAFFWGEPTILANYVDVDTASILGIPDSARAGILNEISDEYRLTQDSLILDQIVVLQAHFMTDTLAQFSVRSPFFPAGEGEDENPEIIYTLHQDKLRRLWWVSSTASLEQRLVYHEYLALPDEDIEALLKR